MGYPHWEAWLKPTQQPRAAAGPRAAESHLKQGVLLLLTAVLTQSEVGDNACEDEGRQEGEGEDEGVEVAVVALPHAVAHPGAVVIKPL